MSHLSQASTSRYEKTAFSERRFFHISCELTIILFEHFVNPAIVCGILRFSDILIISYCRGIKRQHSGSFGINFFKNTVTDLDNTPEKVLSIYTRERGQNGRSFHDSSQNVNNQDWFFPFSIIVIPYNLCDTCDNIQYTSSRGYMLLSITQKP